MKKLIFALCLTVLLPVLTAPCISASEQPAADPYLPSGSETLIVFEIFSTKLNYITDLQMLSFDGGMELAEMFERGFKTAPDNGEFNTTIRDGVHILGIEVTDELVTVDFNIELLTQGYGSGTEMHMLQAITDTIGNFFGVPFVKLTVEGKSYSSGHIYFEDDDYMEVIPQTELKDDINPYFKSIIYRQLFTAGEVKDVAISVKSISNNFSYEKNVFIALVLKEGSMYGDTYEEGRVVGFEGNFSLVALSENGEVLSELEGIFDGDMGFSSGNPIEFCFSDYNGDGYADFIIGQSARRIDDCPRDIVGSVFKMFTYDGGSLRELSINSEKYMLISGKSTSDYLDAVDDTTFKVMEYQEYYPRWFYERCYQWNGEIFAEISMEQIPLVSEEHLDAQIFYIHCWPEHRISIYTINEPQVNDNGSMGDYEGFYLYVNGETTYFPDWTALYNRPPELVSINHELDTHLFGIRFTISYGTGFGEGYTLIYNDLTGGIIKDWARPYYFGVASYGTGIDVYYNEKYSFSLLMPEEWSGKYLVREYEEQNEVWFFHKPTCESETSYELGQIFMIKMYPAEEWDGDLTVFRGYDNFNVLAANGKYVYAYGTPTDFPFTEELYNTYQDEIQMMYQTALEAAESIVIEGAR